MRDAPAEGGVIHKEAETITPAQAEAGVLLNAAPAFDADVEA
ncbi:MAG TPA: hypothetical protein VGF33_06220 [Caulobacteraceae bacterium]